MNRLKEESVIVIENKRRQGKQLSAMEIFALIEEEQKE
jgi:hypothetical protein